jgi:hypothetical protein
MSDPKAEKKERQAADAKAAWDDYLAQKAAVEKNTERLRALRLAKEASEAAGEKPAEKPKERARRPKRGKVG